MEPFVEQYGLLGLFVASLISSTIVPFSTEALLLLAIGLGMSTVEVIGVVTIASAIGGFTTYGIGRAGSILVRRRVKQAKLKVYEKVASRSGAPMIFAASFTPLPYELFAVVAGILKMSVPIFFASTLCGRALRFLIMGAFTKKGFELAQVGEWGIVTVLLIIGLTILLISIYFSWGLIKEFK
ncbi:MAG: VTT domain-containing protein [Candidatus Hodarchaeaceae archaeon]|nr:VTT domain-containing protein [Candidatus Hodarchaeaceae archaeon]